MTTQDVLRQAKELLSDESRWCQGEFARTKDGPASWRSDKAVSWCATGALCRASDVNPLTYIAASRYLTMVTGGIGTFNDDPNTTHADIIAAFDRALLLAAEHEAENVLVALS